MNDDAPPNAEPQLVPLPPRRWTNMVYWVGCLLAAAPVSWLAVQIAALGFSPAGVFPLVVGGLAGLIATLLAHGLLVGSRRVAFGGALLAALGTAGLEHVWFHQLEVKRLQDARLQADVQTPEEAEMLREWTVPPTFGEFMARGGWRARGLWLLDALLLTVGAWLATRIFFYTPWCRRCWHPMDAERVPDDSAARHWRCQHCRRRGAVDQPSGQRLHLLAPPTDSVEPAA